MSTRVHQRWAHLRFSVVGQLLAAPPDKGELRTAIEELAARTWQHPSTGEPVRFGFSTIERWYYRALRERTDPVGVLRRKIRTDAGQQAAIGDAVRREIIAQYAAHKSWSVKLHHDTLRILAERLGNQRDVRIGIVTRPQAGLADFYREMGDLFGVELAPHNRWAGAKVLRDRWQTHIDAALSRPVLIVDEAQEMPPGVLAELRLLSSARLDSHILLTVVIAGDGRLLERLRSEELAPLGSRMRVRLALERATPEELVELLVHGLQKAGAVKLMAPDVITALAEHAQGNPRALMTMAGEVLDFAAQREARHIDEKLFLEVCAPPVTETKATSGRRR